MRQQAFVGVVLVLVTTAALQGVACMRNADEWIMYDEGHQQALDAKRHEGRSLLQAANAVVQTTDGNGAPVTYVVYKTSSPVNWRAAYASCAKSVSPVKNPYSSYMVLASITSASASAAVHNVARGLGLATATSISSSTYANGYWLGLNDVTTEGTFTYPYSAGIAPNLFTSWYTAEPNNAQTGEDCVGVLSNPSTLQAAWLDLRCGLGLAGFVCQALPGAPMPPMPGGSPKIGPTGGLYSGIAAGVSLSWNAARSDCAASGTNLVKISSVAENNFVRDNFFPGEIKYLGASDTAAEGTFRWVSDNSLLNYTNWALGEPNGFTTENYLMMWNNVEGNWNDHPGTNAFAYVCWVPTF